MRAAWPAACPERCKDRNATAALTKLLAGTCLGGSENDDAWDVAVDLRGDVYVAGLTGSADFPVSARAYGRAFDQLVALMEKR